MIWRSSRIVRSKASLEPSGRVSKRILVAVDGSQSSLRAAKVGVQLAKPNEAELIAVSVIPRPAYGPPPVTELKREVETSIATVTSLETDLDSETKNWIHDHARILEPAVKQYEKDVKQLLDEAHEKLSGPNLRELELELARIAAEIAKLTNI